MQSPVVAYALFCCVLAYVVGVAHGALGGYIFARTRENGRWRRLLREQRVLGKPVSVTVKPGSSVVAALQSAVASMARLVPAVAFLAAGQARAGEPPAYVSLETGAAVSVSEDTAALPVLRLAVDGPVYLGRTAPLRLRITLGIYGSPDATAVDPRDVRTFRAAEVSADVGRIVGQSRDGSSATLAILTLGAAARRDARGAGPRQRFPGWAAAGVAVERRDPDTGAVVRRLAIAYGSDQLSSPDAWTPRHVLVSGHVQLARVVGIDLALGGDVHRPLWGEGRSVFRLFSVFSWRPGVRK